MEVRMVKISGCSAFWEGEGTLTDEHPQSSYGKPVFVPDAAAWIVSYQDGQRSATDVDVFGPAAIGPGYLHRMEGETYTAEQEAWVNELIIAAHTDREPGASDRHFRFGASWKTPEQLREIERRLGTRMFRSI